MLDEAASSPIAQAHVNAFSGLNRCSQIGIRKDATCAIRFQEMHGYSPLGSDDKDRLLR